MRRARHNIILYYVLYYIILYHLSYHVTQYNIEVYFMIGDDCVPLVAALHQRGGRGARIIMLLIYCYINIILVLC